MTLVVTVSTSARDIYFLADVLGIRVGADITLDAGDGLSLIDLDGL